VFYVLKVELRRSSSTQFHYVAVWIYSDCYKTGQPVTAHSGTCEIRPRTLPLPGVCMEFVQL